MPITRFPNGFQYGVSLRGINVLATHAGNVFWVDSAVGADSGDGIENQPFATLDYAVGRCTASNGDIIILKPGHAETIIADSGVDIDVAGVTVIGVGNGAARPTFTFTTAVAADFKLAANDTYVENILFVAGIDALTGPIEISADGCSLVGCEYQDDDSNNYETTDVIVTASTPLRMLIDGFKYIHDGGSGGTQNQSVIQLNGADKAIIRNCWLVADSGTGVIEDATTSDQILVENCVVESTNASPVVGILLTATTSGTMRNVHIRVASGTTYLTAANDMQFFECFGSGTDATAGEKIGTQLAGDIEAKIDVIDAYHDVASADATTNTVMSDVIGNKTDAAQPVVGTTRSLVGMTKGLMNSTVRTVVKTDGAVHTTPDPLFDIAGGPIHVLSIIGRVTTDIQAQAATQQLQALVTTPAGTVNLSTAVETNGDAAGTIYTFLGPTAILTPTTAGASILDVGHATLAPSQWIVPIGNIQVVGGDINTGVVEWTMAYLPLSPSAVVTAAA